MQFAFLLVYAAILATLCFLAVLSVVNHFSSFQIPGRVLTYLHG